MAARGSLDRRRPRARVLLDTIIAASALLALASCGKLRSCSSGRAARAEETMKEATPSPIEELTVGGSTPVQGEGRLKDGRSFYFRARHEEWSFGVASSVDEAVSNPVWQWSEPWGDRPEQAGYMPEEEARLLIETCAEMLAQGTSPPPSPDAVMDGTAQGKPPEEVFARRMARAMVADLLLYHAGEIADASARVEAEYRQEFQKRVDPRFHEVFEDALAHLDEIPRGEQVARWLVDEASARSVGKRWALAIRRAPQAERSEMLTRAKRWLAAWSASPEIERVWRRELEGAIPS
jgi:hypothetical protein